MDSVLIFLYSIICLVFVVTLHEFAHAWTANFLGDPTAKHKGRISLNPLQHLDPVGTILMFLIGFGWGKPVPVNSSYFKNPKLYEAITALAGPLMNLFVAVVASIPLRYFPNYIGPELSFFLNVLVDISLVLFAFNMLPFPPLDGSKFIQIFIPRRFEHKYDEYLAKAGIYFMAFVLIDNFILGRYFPPVVNFFGLQVHFPILQNVIGSIWLFLKTLIFLGN